MLTWWTLILQTSFAAELPNSTASSESSPSKSYSAKVLADKPIAYWRFQGDQEQMLKNEVQPKTTNQQIVGKIRGQIQDHIAGPRPVEKKFGYQDFDLKNQAIKIKRGSNYLAFEDPGDESPLDFQQGDSITLEAWVNPSELRKNSNVYILGKGRTNRPNFAANNQNYALRLREKGNARLSFLFRDADQQADSDSRWHRWTSQSGFYPGTAWHHVAVCYTFGKPDSLKAFIDGQQVSGSWDMGGKSKKPPVVDNDQLWIGSSLGGNPNNTFIGSIDEVAIYRHLVPEENLKNRYHFRSQSVPPLKIADLPDDQVVVQLTEKISDTRSWNISNLPVSETFKQPSFSFLAIPHKYNSKGLITDRTKSFLMRAHAAIEFTEGEYEFLLRSLGGSRLWIDGELISTNRFLQPGGDAHSSVPDLPATKIPEMHPLPAGHTETITKTKLTGGKHHVMVEILVGGNRVRPEIGETGLFVRQNDEMFTLVSPSTDFQILLSESAWQQFTASEVLRYKQVNLSRRQHASVQEDNYWQKRHQMAKTYIESLTPVELTQVKDQSQINNEVDHFIQAKLETAKIEPAALTSDHVFLRRVYLDTVGVIPTQAEQTQFFAQKKVNRRPWVIDRLLDDPRSADHATAYWQDVLAENPGILKPKLNNTGPFRWWIYESFLQNKPMDRFATELILMEGSKYYGGPAGFEMASQNDVPMAAKAHILGQAFQAVEMKCARCHDAPYHDVTQGDLFNLAAMLKRAPQEIPSSSSVPLSDEATNSSLITVSYKPGTKIEPKWPFPEFLAKDAKLVRFQKENLRNPNDSREQLAFAITSPANNRFARVLVNRLWQRYFGTGLVSSVDDWELSNNSHPKLLEYLARQLVANQYDLRHVSRLILNSQAYQRSADAQLAEATHLALPLFAAQVHRRLSAEQILDSLFLASGKSFESEPLTMDPLGRLSVDAFLNLGKPDRAWQFTSLSNERDRPSLAIPRAQSLVDVLTAFGWRAMRQNPQSVRDTTPVVQQPAILANGAAVRRVVGFSETSRFTQIALESDQPEQFVTDIYQQILSRKPNSTELDYFSQLLTEGFETRKTGEAPKKKEKLRFSVSWTNHLSKEANEMKIRLEEEVRRGDPSTVQLTTAWRERAEDMVWALINSPEFIFTP